MITKAFAIYDSKAESFGIPFFQLNSGVAIRAFTQLIHDEKTMIKKYLGDFTLFELGIYDDIKGKFESLKSPVSLGMALEYAPADVKYEI